MNKKIKTIAIISSLGSVAVLATGVLASEWTTLQQHNIAQGYSAKAAKQEVVKSSESVYPSAISRQDAEVSPMNVMINKKYDLDEFNHGSTWFTHHHTHFKIKIAVLPKQWRQIKFFSRTLLTKGKRKPMLGQATLFNNGYYEERKTVYKTKKYEDDSLLLHLDNYDSYLRREDNIVYYEGSYDRAYRSWQKGIYSFTLESFTGTIIK